MDKEFIPYEQALALKELGFDEPCLAWYPVHEVLLFMGMKLGSTTPDFVTQNSPWIRSEKIKTCIAPTFSQAFGWFREEYGLFVSPNVISYENAPYLWFFEINSTVLPFGTDLGETDDYKTYEEAEQACLIKLIEIVKQKHN
jgi:hypothetical protein